VEFTKKTKAKQNKHATLEPELLLLKQMSFNQERYKHLMPP